MNDRQPPFDAAAEHNSAETTAGISPAVVSRVKAEFNEMRGFSPTLIQAARLFDLSPAECVRVLESLVDEGILQTTPDGCYRLTSPE